MDTQLVIRVFEVVEGRGVAMVGGTTLPLFNKKGRLKTGPQRLQVRFMGEGGRRRGPSSCLGLSVCVVSLLSQRQC